jgi:integrase/recombinase XerC
VPKFNARNERIKHRYFNFLSEAKQLSTGTVDQVAAALADFEQATGHRDFRLFRSEQAQSYKHRLAKAINAATKRPLAKATINSRLAALKAFFQWLSQQPGFRRMNYADAEYFNMSANDERVAKAVRDRPAPTVEQIRHVVFSQPYQTDIERRNQALIAFTLLSGARDDAIASMSLKHVDIHRREVNQDAREVRTKNAKTMRTWFFPFDDMEIIVRDWMRWLQEHRLWGPDDPLFPATKIEVGASGHYENCGLDRKHWKSAGAIRQIFRAEFKRAGLPYFNPHSVRKTLALYGLKHTPNLEAFKAWSQNLGHSKMLTTLNSYAKMEPEKQAEIMSRLRTDLAKSGSGPDPETVQRVVDYLVKQAIPVPAV